MLLPEEAYLYSDALHYYDVSGPSQFIANVRLIIGVEGMQDVLLLAQFRLRGGRVEAHRLCR